LSKIRKLVEVDDNLEPKDNLITIFGKFPITCSKCFKEISSRNDLISFCEESNFENFAWFSALHIQCVNEIGQENDDQVLVPISLLRHIDPDLKYTKFLLGKKKGTR